MKQTILVVLLLACLSVQAQKPLPKHEIAVSYGYPTIAFAPHSTDPYCAAFKDAWFGKEKEFGPLSIEYYHRSNKWLSVGGILTAINIRQDIDQNGVDIGDYSERYYSLMPAVKFSWLRGEFIGLYSKVALGLALHSEKMFGTDAEGVKVDDTTLKVGPMYHVTLLGMEIGGRLRVFGEFGVGVKGVYSAGLRYQF